MSFFRAKTEETRKVLPARYWKGSITASVYCSPVSYESAEESRRQIYDDMKSCRIRREKDMDGSMEFARHYTCG